MWNSRYLYRIDWRIVIVIFSLMVVSLLVISSTDPAFLFNAAQMNFFTPKVQNQMKHFMLGWGIFILFAGMDYNKIRDWAWILYLIMVIALVGLFFAPAIQNVHRWYRIPFLGVSVQPSEYSKLIVVIALSWFLERCRSTASSWQTTCQGLLIVGIPFLLILKQPDLGTALVLCPVTCVMFYLGNLHPAMVRFMMISGGVALLVILLIFSGVFPHEKMYPYVTKVMKEYQYERLNPDNHHQWAATTAIGVGGWTGSGWRASEFTGRGWLPYGYTDSVFPAFGEEFGFLGLIVLLVLFYSLVYFGFQVTVRAKDHFGRMLSAGVSVYLAMHILVNIGMMCHLLPVTGVPLILVSYGGSSVCVTMAALGILQSIYSRRFMF
ncbi:MAG: Peptidoglycan glycosyltransferase MrdB [Chlamydiales bacterium]|nr:Peptidoglycan glycosyltransferase MrdB [Chlamydiales bacterium]MCH9619422.1 Peptidoglycan glycosyltransferase MrdB [Chlamydiales bacterium]MCH9622226.1 Peptidoglycan glycosyltransferase MrdB [Chlamydiales bacterium]